MAWHGRLLFACFPLPAAAILTWVAVSFGGAAASVAPCLALVMYAAVGLYAVPLRSGLGGGGAGGVRMGCDVGHFSFLFFKRLKFRVEYSCANELGLLSRCTYSIHDEVKEETMPWSKEESDRISDREAPP